MFLQRNLTVMLYLMMSYFIAMPFKTQIQSVEIVSSAIFIGVLKKTVHLKKDICPADKVLSSTIKCTYGCFVSAGTPYQDCHSANLIFLMISSKCHKRYAKKQKSLTFLLWLFIEAVLVTFFAIAFVFFVDTISMTVIILSHSITEVSALPFKYLLFSQIYVLGFQF